jgi:membrane protease YdiL (CAAX protease family)
MFRKPAFWILLTVVAGLCLVFAVVNFPKAFPIVNVEIEMDREAALGEAGELARRFGWGPETARMAAAFELDQQLQSFVELEAGGTETFSRMIGEGLCWPYSWRVRRFAEFDANETMIRFSPDGRPIGFRETIPEDRAGPALDATAAREIAELAALDHWDVELGEFELVEEAVELRPSGRADHTFTYQRPAPTVGEEGRYRLRLGVSGDRFTELTHFVKIPEAFSRRYEEMRSANNGIAVAASVAAAILYVVGGCVIGLFLLLRKRWVLWRPALKWGIVVAALQALVVLNQWPLAWMGYDTAISAANFTLQQVVMALIQFVGMGILLTVSFMAAESLTRRAFPHHLQLWRSWDTGVAGTSTVAGLTVSGYLLVAIFFAYDVALYLFAGSALGWWNPSFALYDPNVIATYLPWLSSVAISLQAGFWEECLFRAIPIASAALLGERFGGRRWWILGALVLQAVVFGAGHANYPAQPAYARLVELILPAVGFGLLYLAFGLLPAIVLHFAFDVVWIALPLFAAAIPGIWVDRVIVIGLTLIPLWVVLWRRSRSDRWSVAPDRARNEAWSPPPAAEPVAETAAADRSRGLDARARLALGGAGALGIVLWAVLGGGVSDVPGIDITRRSALDTARAQTEALGIEIGESWRELSAVRGEPNMEDRFVWREGDAEAYDALMGSYLDPPRWLVRFASFEGDVVERAEEVVVSIAGGGGVLRLAHRLPESRPGAALDEAAARELAETALADRFGVSPEAVAEVSAEPEQQPDRVDWKFVFRDERIDLLDRGEPRIAIHLAGNEVVDGYRFVHVPEEWERAERNRRSSVQLIQVVCVVILMLVFVGGAVVAVVRWSRGRFAPRTFAITFGTLAVISCFGLFNGWPAIAAQFSTAQPFGLQSAMVVAGGLLVLIATAVGVGLTVGMVHRWQPEQPATSGLGSLLPGAGLGAAFAGVSAVASRIVPPLDASWPSFKGAAARSPFLAAALDPVAGWIAGTAGFLLVYAAVDALWRRRPSAGLPTALALLAFGLVASGADGVPTIARWLGTGLVTGILLVVSYLLVFRHHLALVPVAAAVLTALTMLREGLLGAYPGAAVGAAVGGAIIVVLGVLWSKAMERDSRTRAPAEVSV